MSVFMPAYILYENVSCFLNKEDLCEKAGAKGQTIRMLKTRNIYQIVVHRKKNATEPRTTQIA